MKGFVENIEELTTNNSLFRKVLYTGKHTQLVLMSLPPKGRLAKKFMQTTISFSELTQGRGKW